MSQSSDQTIFQSAQGAKKGHAKMTLAEKEKISHEAHTEAVKDVIIEAETNVKKLDNLVKKSEDVLLVVTSVFPFTLFTDKIIITEEKVSVIYKNFFWSESVRSVLGKDIAHVNVQSSIFFATLTIVDKYFTKDPLTIPFLKKREAFEARRLIQGMIIAGHQGIDTTKLNIPDVKEKLEAVGRAFT